MKAQASLGKSPDLPEPSLLNNAITVNHILSSHLKIGKTKVLMENGSLVKVVSIDLH